MSNKISEYILKHSSKKNQKLKYDFMPTIFELIERPANNLGKVIIYITFSLLIIAIVWASLAKTDTVVTAGGSIVPEGNNIAIKSYIPGTVKEICVSEGENVKKGDVLLKLNSETETDIKQIKNQIKIVSAEVDVYSKLLNKTDVSKISPDSYDEVCKSYVETIIENENSYLLSKQSLELEQKSAKLEYELAVTTKESYEGNPDYEIELKSQSKVVEQKKLLMTQGELNVKSLETEHMQKLNNNYSQKKTELSELKSQLDKYQQADDYNQIIAPADGCVSNMKINAIGDTVNSYEELIEIVPSDASLQMKCYIKNKDMADISVGDLVQIKLDAYSYSDYGTIPGRIVYISPNSYTMENLENVYQVTAEIANENKEIEIFAGLSGSMEIKTGEKTILSYFLEPVLNGFNDMLKEK